jgi:hypothetical protein
MRPSQGRGNGHNPAAAKKIDNPLRNMVARANATVRRGVGLPTRARNVDKTVDGRGDSGESVRRAAQKLASSYKKPKQKSKSTAGWNKNNWKASEWDHGGVSLPNVSEPKFGMAGFRQSMGLPTTGKNVKSYNRLANADILPEPHWDPSRDLWTSGDPKEQFVQRKVDKWLAPYDEEPTWGNFFTNWQAGRDKPGQTQQKAFRDTWEDEYEKRYEGRERNIAEKALGWTFGQDLDSDSIDKSNLALNTALLLFPYGKAGQAAKGAAGSRAASKAFKPGFKTYSKETAARAGS